MQISGSLLFPAINVNDSVTKSKHSLVMSDVGKGCLMSLKSNLVLSCDCCEIDQYVLSEPSLEDA
ncbi:hypothetical protein Leryth_019967 [Lithospermum erythrorhizon]|nr:hypothetical protein Leryth_019967 [Lithospermum erythrorhizon]